MSQNEKLFPCFWSPSLRLSCLCHIQKFHLLLSKLSEFIVGFLKALVVFCKVSDLALRDREDSVFRYFAQYLLIPTYFVL